MHNSMPTNLIPRFKYTNDLETKPANLTQEETDNLDRLISIKNLINN